MFVPGHGTSSRHPGHTDGCCAPEPEPGPEPMDMDPEPECIEPDNAFYTEFYPGASEPIGRGQTFMEVFDEGGYAAERAKNPYYPFASQGEWQVAHYLLKSRLSMAAIDEFLKLELVRSIMLL